MYGASVFDESHHNKSYSKEFKEMVVKEYLAGNGSIIDLALGYNFPSESTVLSWISSHNNHIELKDYNPKSEVYMAKRQPKTSLTEIPTVITSLKQHLY